MSLLSIVPFPLLVLFILAGYFTAGYMVALFENPCRLLEAAVRHENADRVAAMLQDLPYARFVDLWTHVPSWYTIVAMTAADARAQERIVGALAEHFGNFDNDGRLTEHPLSIAYQRGNAQLATVLVEHGAVPEVYSASLTCPLLRLLSPAVAVVTGSRERRLCMLQHPRRVPYADSQLRQRYGWSEELALAQAHPYHSKNPFRAPTLNQPVVSPFLFRSMEDALAFYANQWNLAPVLRFRDWASRWIFRLSVCGFLGVISIPIIAQVAAVRRARAP